MVLHSSSLAVEFIVNGPRGKLRLGVIEPAGSGANGSETLGRALGETKQTALREHRGRRIPSREVRREEMGWSDFKRRQSRRCRPQTKSGLASP